MNSVKTKKLLTLLGDKKLLIVLLVLILFPLVLLSFFNHPGPDDYDFAYKTKLHTFYEVQFWRYNNEGGRYFANGILSLNPLVFNNYVWFRIIPILVLTLFILALNFFVKSILTPISKTEKWTYVGLIVLVFFYQLPDVCSAFYWTTGAITYQFPMTLCLFLGGFLFRYYTKGKITDLLFALLLLAALLGCNEIAVVETVFMFFLAVVYRFLIVKKRDMSLMLVLLVTLCFAGVALLAPGNGVRGEHYPEKHLFFNSVYRTSMFALDYFLKWIPMLLFVGLFMADSLYENLAKMNSKWFVHPVLAFFMMGMVVFLGIFPGLWVSNSLMEDRVINEVYFFFLFTTLYFTCCLLQYLIDKHDYKIRLSKDLKIILGVFLIIYTFSDTPVFNAYHDVLTGRAYRYNKEMNQRLELIKANNKTKVTLPALQNRPFTIYNGLIMGLTNDKNNWKNDALIKYYDKELVIKPTDSIFTE